MTSSIGLVTVYIPALLIYAGDARQASWRQHCRAGDARQASSTSPKARSIEFLYSSSDSVRLTSIWGFGGVGGTALGADSVRQPLVRCRRARNRRKQIRFDWRAALGAAIAAGALWAAPTSSICGIHTPDRPQCTCSCTCRWSSFKSLNGIPVGVPVCQATHLGSVFSVLFSRCSGCSSSPQGPPTSIRTPSTDRRTLVVFLPSGFTNSLLDFFTNNVKRKRSSVKEKFHKKCRKIKIVPQQVSQRKNT